MSLDEKSEERMLIRKAKQGNTEAFELLVKKYQQSIYYLCHRMIGIHQAADDISQETFVKAFFSLPKFNEEMNFFTWIRKITVNNTLNYLKRMKREEPLGKRENRITENLYSSSQELPQEKLEKMRMQEKFKEALQTLPADQRIIFILRVYEDQSYKDISKLLNIPHGTVMSRLNRARKKLRVLMADYLEGRC